MTAAAAPAFRTVAFGDLAAGFWGVMLAGQLTFLAVGAADAPPQSVARAAIDCPGASEDWRISGAGADLVVSGEGEPARGSAPERFDQLCRVRGHVEAVELELDCLGVRATRDEGEVNQFASIRGISAWFEPGEGVAVLALRPRKAAGHSSDAVTATVFDPDGPVAVAEPRLSTTYGADELPSRMSLELWIGEEEAERYPRRFAGELAGPGVTAVQAGFDVRAAPLRCHSRGRDGAGVYLLARRA